MTYKVHTYTFATFEEVIKFAELEHGVGLLFEDGLSEKEKHEACEMLSEVIATMERQAQSTMRNYKIVLTEDQFIAVVELLNAEISDIQDTVTMNNLNTVKIPTELLTEEYNHLTGILQTFDAAAPQE
jgi:hypothetical protein